VSKSEYEALQTDYHKLNTNYEVLQEDNSNLQAGFDNLQTDYNILLEEKANLEAEYKDLQTISTELQTNFQAEVEGLQSQIEELGTELQGYRDTGIKIFTIDNLPKISKYGTGGISVISFEDPPDEDCVTLLNYPHTENPSFEELMQFLSEDDTDSVHYASSYTWGKICGWFAESIHNKAEEAGITSAFVVLEFWGGPGHALNAFNTTDRGLVFIDCTGKTSPLYIEPYNPYTITYTIGDIDNEDKIVYVKRGYPLGYININMPYGLEYSEYERWQNDVEVMRQRINFIRN